MKIKPEKRKVLENLYVEVLHDQNYYNPSHDKKIFKSKHLKNISIFRPNDAAGGILASPWAKDAFREQIPSMSFTYHVKNII